MLGYILSGMCFAGGVMLFLFDAAALGSLALIGGMFSFGLASRFLARTEKARLMTKQLELAVAFKTGQADLMQQQFRLFGLLGKIHTILGVSISRSGHTSVELSKCRIDCYGVGLGDKEHPLPNRLFLTTPFTPLRKYELFLTDPKNGLFVGYAGEHDFDDDILATMSGAPQYNKEVINGGHGPLFVSVLISDEFGYGRSVIAQCAWLVIVPDEKRDK